MKWRHDPTRYIFLWLAKPCVEGISSGRKRRSLEKRPERYSVQAFFFAVHYGMLFSMALPKDMVVPSPPYGENMMATIRPFSNGCAAENGWYFFLEAPKAKQQHASAMDSAKGKAKKAVFSPCCGDEKPHALTAPVQFPRCGLHSWSCLLASLFGCVVVLRVTIWNFLKQSLYSLKIV